MKCNWCYVTWVAVARVAADPVTSGLESFAMLAVFGAPVTSTTHTKTPTWAASRLSRYCHQCSKAVGYFHSGALQPFPLRALTQIFTPGRELQKSQRTTAGAHPSFGFGCFGDLNEESFFSWWVAVTLSFFGNAREHHLEITHASTRALPVNN